MKSIGVPPNISLYKVVLLIIVIIYFVQLKDFFINKNYLQIIGFTCVLGTFFYYIINVNHIIYDDKNIVMKNVIKDCHKQRIEFENIYSYAGFLDLYRVKFKNDDKLYLISLTLNFTITTEKNATIKSIIKKLEIR
jgi:hypothetical protein